MLPSTQCLCLRDNSSTGHDARDGQGSPEKIPEPRENPEPYCCHSLRGSLGDRWPSLHDAACCATASNAASGASHTFLSHSSKFPITGSHGLQLLVPEHAPAQQPWPQRQHRTHRLQRHTMHLACHMTAECNIIQEAQLLKLLYTAPTSRIASSCSPDAIWVSLETKLLVEAHRCRLGRAAFRSSTLTYWLLLLSSVTSTHQYMSLEKAHHPHPQTSIYCLSALPSGTPLYGQP